MLTGPKKITLADDALVEEADASFNWFYNESNLDRTRAESLVEPISALNEHVEVNSVKSNAIDETFLKKYQIFFLTDCFDRIAIEGWNELCRKNDIGMVLVNVIGGLGSIFVDLGASHRLEDKYLNSKKRQYYVKNISNGRPGVVDLYPIGDPPQYAAGDFVSLSGVEGMTQVNGTEARPVRPITDFSFSIEPTTSFAPYTSGGLVTYEKVPISLRFASFKDNLLKPRLLKAEEGQKGLTQLELHVALAIYLELKEEVEQEVCTLADTVMSEEINQSISDVVSTKAYIKKLIAENQLSNTRVKKLALQLVMMRMDQIPAAVSIMAGLAAFQLIPFVGKMQPINQLAYYDMFEDVPVSLTETLGDCLGMEPLYVHLQNYRQVNPQIVDHINCR